MTRTVECCRCMTRGHAAYEQLARWTAYVHGGAIKRIIYTDLIKHSD